MERIWESIFNEKLPTRETSISEGQLLEIHRKNRLRNIEILTLAQEIVKITLEDNFILPEQRMSRLKDIFTRLEFEYFLIIQDKNSNFFNISLGNTDQKNYKKFNNLVMSGCFKWMADTFGKQNLRVTVVDTNKNETIFDSKNKFEFLQDEDEK